MLSLCSDCNPKSRQVPMNDRIPAFNRKKQINMVWLRNTDEAALLHKQWSEHLLSLKEQYCAREQRLDWMLPVSRVASEGGGQSSDPINRMKSLRWYQRAPKLPLMPQDFSMCIRLQCRGFWLKLVRGYQCEGVIILCEPLPVGDTSPEILRMVNSGKRRRLKRHDFLGCIV